MALKVVKVGQIGEPEKGLTLVQLQGVKYGILPRWWNRIWGKEARHRGDRHHHWYDHVGRDGDTLIAEPYGIFLDDLRDLVELCDKYDLEIVIDSASQHFPTRTLCIQLTPRGKK